jgi:hypothetical protein
MEAVIEMVVVAGGKGSLTFEEKLDVTKRYECTT